MLRSGHFHQKARVIVLKWKFDSTPDKSTRTVKLDPIEDEDKSAALVKDGKSEKGLEMELKDCTSHCWRLFHFLNGDVNAALRMH